MPNYLVHSYAIVRVETCVEAASVRKAVLEALVTIDSTSVKFGEFSGELQEFHIVDLLDEKYQRVEYESISCEWESPDNLIDSHTLREVL